MYRDHHRRGGNNMRVSIRSFGALKHKDFRYFWIGASVSLIGTWMQSSAQSWLVLTLTNSPAKLSFVSALQFIPVLLFSLFAGAIIDNYSKKKLILYTQSLMGILAVILTLLVATNTIRYWHILILATLLGCLNAIDMPARQSYMIELVGKSDLMNAIALNSTVFNAARMIGPAVAGLFIKFFGFFICFLINAVSFLPLIYGLIKIQTLGLPKKDKVKENVTKEIVDGIKYVVSVKEIASTILLIFMVSAFGMNYSVLIPLLAKQGLNMEADGYGYLMSAMGAGSMIMAFYIAARSRKPKKKVTYMAACTLGALLIVIGLGENFILSAGLLFLAGICNILFSTTSNSSLQLKAKDEYRGRVMSIYAMVFAGSTPIGSLMEGFLTNRYGITNAFIISGILTIMTALLTYIIFSGIFRNKNQES